MMKIAKPVTAGITAAAIDRLYFKTPMLASNIGFGVAVGLGLFAGDLAAKATPVHGAGAVVAKSLEARALEIGFGSTLSFVLDRYLMESYASYDVVQRVGSIVAAEVVGEYVSNSFLGLA